MTTQNDTTPKTVPISLSLNPALKLKIEEIARKRSVDEHKLIRLQDLLREVIEREFGQ